MASALTVSGSALLIAVLAVWRLTHLLWGEDGPADVFVRMRHAAGNGILGRLLDCFYCLSLWVAAPVAWVLGNGWRERALLWLAVSGGAIVVERLSSQKTTSHQVAQWHEEPLPDKPKEENNPNVMLWR